MRIDHDTCRDPDLLAAEVRRLRAVIAAGEPALTGDEREALGVAAAAYARRCEDGVGLLNDGPKECGVIAATLRGLLERQHNLSAGQAADG